MSTSAARAALFDFDGTIINSEPLHMLSIAQVVRARAGVELTEEELAYVLGHAWQDIEARLHLTQRTGLSLPQFQVEAVRAKDELLARGEWTPTLMPGVEHLLRLCADVPRAIVTGSCRSELEQLLSKLSVADAFAFAITADDVTHGKPDPEGYLAAAQRLGVSAQDCVVFEDSTAGIRAGRRAGARVIGCSFAIPAVGHPAHQDQSEAHAVVSQWTEVTPELLWGGL